MNLLNIKFQFIKQISGNSKIKSGFGVQFLNRRTANNVSLKILCYNDMLFGIARINSLEESNYSIF